MLRPLTALCDASARAYAGVLLEDFAVSESPKLLIAGCGDIGCRVALRLLRHGWRVQGLRRDIAALPEGVAAIQGDLEQPLCPAQWPAGKLDYLLYAADMMRSVTGPPTSRAWVMC